MTLLVLAILITLAVPALTHWIGRHQLRVAQNDYLAALRHARGVAIHEQARVMFCASRDGVRCNEGNDWSGGWLIGRMAENGNLEDEPLFTHADYAPRLLISGNGNRAYVRFGADGSTGAVTNQSVFLCLRDQPEQVRVIRIARLGRVRGDRLAASDSFTCAGD